LRGLNSIAGDITRNRRIMLMGMPIAAGIPSPYDIATGEKGER